MTVLTCPRCQHAHTQDQWEYQSGHCHACGAVLTTPETEEFADWNGGPLSKAGQELEDARAIAERTTPKKELPAVSGVERVEATPVARASDSVPPTATKSPPRPTQAPPPPPPPRDPRDGSSKKQPGKPSKIQLPADIQVSKTGKLKKPAPKKGRRGS